VSDLHGGDMAVVIDHPDKTTADVALERAYRIIGRTVVLIRICNCGRCGSVFYASRAPYWIVSGAIEVHSIGHASLRKIPPADLGMDVLTEEEVTL
jgi:hypothetical protein